MLGQWMCQSHFTSDALRGQRLAAAYSPNLLFFCLLFGGREGGGQSFWELSSPEAAGMRPLDAADPHIPRAHVPRSQAFWSGLPHTWPEHCGESGYPGLWAPSQPCSHPRHEGRWHWVSAGLKLHAPALSFFTR